MEASVPFVDPQAWLMYVQGLIRDIDPNTSNLINNQTIANYLQVVQAKFNQSCMQLELDPSQIQLVPPPENNDEK